MTGLTELLRRRRGLLFLQAVALLPLLLVIVAFGLLLRQERRSEELRLRSSAEALAHELHVYLKLQEAGLSLAARLTTQRALGTYLVLNETRLTHPALTSIIATNADGLVIVTNGDKLDAPAFGASVAGSPGFESVRSQRVPQVSGVYDDPNDPGTLLLELTVPRIDTRQSFVGVVRGTLDIGAFTTRLASVGRFHDYDHLITDREGRIIATPAGLGLKPLEVLPALAGTGWLEHPAGPGVNRAGYVAHCEDCPFRVASLRPVVPQNSWLIPLAAVAIAVAATAFLTRRLALRARELEAARAAAVAASESKTAFVAMTSHEIRTPLNAIIGLADSLVEQTRPSVARDQLVTIRGAGELLLHVVEDLLDLSRVEAGRFELRVGAVDVVVLCREVCALFSLQARRQKIDLQLSVTLPDNLWVETDPGRLRQVLINLVGNALKFTRHGSVRLQVEAMRESKDRITLLFAVCDTGPGIPRDRQSRLFEPYYQVESTVSGVAGTGLGLHISRRLVGLLGGHIKVESVPSAGSRFYFDLDLPRLAPPTPAGPAPAAEAVHRLRILAADDNSANQEVFRSLLEGKCAALVVVGRAADALERLRAEPFDLALIDLEMPDGDGFSVVRSLRENPGASSGCRVLAVSAHAQGSMRTRSLDAGFSDFIEKPIRRTAFFEALRRAAIPPI